MDWIIQDLKTSYDKALVAEASRQGHHVKFWNIKDFYTNSIPDCVIHTCCDLVKTIKVPHLTPLKELRCQNYYPFIGEFLANNDYRMLPLGEISRFMSKELISYPFFVRPDTNDKLFSGQVIKGAKAVNDQELGLDELLWFYPPSTLAVVSVPKTFRAEWRTVIHRGKVLTASLYRQSNVHDELEHDVLTHGCATSFAEEVAKHLPVGLVLYCIDIALEEDGDTFSVIEIGGINCAGFYSGHDLAKIVTVMSEETALLFEADDVGWGIYDVGWSNE